LLLAVGAGWWFVHQSGLTPKAGASSPGAANSPASATPSATDQKSIAVLPFVNMSADKADEYLSDGMTEELLNVLAQVPGLHVPGRSSCFAFKGTNEEGIFRTVGEQLHVTTVLEGSVRKVGDKLRITAQLISVADGFHLWSQTYDRDMKDILAVQTEVAQQVVQVLQVKLGVEAARALVKKSTENAEAHRLYLLGRYHFTKATQAGWSDAIQAFNQAFQLDPSYALAYCGLADNYNFLGGSFMPGKEAWAKEKDAAENAVSLDSNLADAHLSLALALAGDFDWPGMDREMNRALELNPNLALARDQYAWLLTVLGRFDEAVAQSRRAVELDPLSPLINVNLAWWLNCARRFDEAIAQSRKTLALDPNYAWAHRTLGWSLHWKGDAAGALAALQKAQSLDPDP
jgi:TolB-like protein/predicted component of type VI protein secretion system